MKLKTLVQGRIVPLLLAAGACLLCSSLNSSLRAQTITWSAPVSMNGLTAAQILTNTNTTPGTIVGAVSFYNPSPTVVSLATNLAPVVFDGSNDPTVASIVSTNTLYTGYGDWSGTSSNATFDGIINGYVFTSSPIDIKLINLVPGAKYSVQLFAVYDYNGITANFQNATNSTNVSSTYAEASNDYVVGTFTMPTNSSSITIQQNVPAGAITLSALVVRAVSFTPPITFTQQPTNSTYVDLGSNVTYSAMAIGPNPLVPQWQYGPAGGPYTNLANSSHYSGVNTYSLTISNVTAADASYVYTLQLSSGTNSSNSTAATLSTFGNAGVTNSIAASNGISALNTAIYNTYSAGGGTVLLGSGTVSGTVEMYPNVNLRGAGESNTVIEGTVTEGIYGNNKMVEDLSVYGGVTASQYSEGDTPGAGFFFGDYNNDDHFLFFKNCEVEGTDIAMQLIGVNGCTLINCNFHDNGLGYSHSIYFTGDYGVTMNNCYSSWSLAGDGVHNDFAGSLASYTYIQSDYSGNEGLGLLVQNDGSNPNFNMQGCTVQFNGQSGGEGDGVNESGSGSVQGMRMDWNHGYGFNDNSSGTEAIFGATGIGNSTDYFYSDGAVEYFSFNATQSGSEQFAYDACMAPNIAGPNNTADWVTAVNGYGGGGAEGNVGFFNGSHPVNGSITWPYVGAPTNGNYQIHVWYANGSSNTLAMPMTVNGTNVGTVQFPPTGSWTSYVNGNGLYANLTSSNNTVSLSVLSPGLGAPVIQAIYVPTAAPATPAAPTGLTAVPNTNAPQSSMMTWITLNWNPVSQASCYNIYRNGLPIAKNVTGTTFTDTHVLGAGTSETYAVTAYNQTGEGSSASVSAVSRQATPSYCDAVAGGNEVSLSVPATPGAVSYTFSRSTTSGGPYTALVTTTNTSYTDTAVTDGTTYYYVATASNSTSQSFPTAQASAVPFVPYSGSPVLIDVDLGTGATQSGAAVLGTNGDHWNAVSATTSTIVNSAGTTLSGVGLSLSDNGVYTDTGGTAMDSNTTALMEDYAYGYTSGTADVTISVTGLSAYKGANLTLVIYAAGDTSGQGATLSLTGGAMGGNSGSALSTTATSRQVSAGIGVAYQTFTGTVTSTGTLSFSATELSGESFTVVNGFQLYLTAP